MLIRLRPVPRALLLGTVFCRLATVLAAISSAELESFKPRTPSQIIKEASESNPNANAIREFCSMIGKSDSACVDTFFKESATAVSSITKQATANCMSKIAASQAQTDALRAAFNVDPAEMAKYADLQTSYTVRLPNGELVIKHASPSDVDKAMGMARKEWTSNAEQIEKYVTMTNGVLASKFGVPVGLAVGGVTIAAFGSDWGEKWGNYGAVDGARYPEKYLKSYTGECKPSLQTCVDKGSIPAREYLNPFYKKPDLNVDNENDNQQTTKDLFDMTLDLEPERTDQATTAEPAPATQDGSAPTAEAEESNVHIDPNADPDRYLKMCVREEEALITKQIGTVREDPNASTNGFFSEEDKRKNADSQLRMGLCDNTYWPAGFCEQWKRDLQVIPLDPDVQQAMAMFKQLQLLSCPRLDGSDLSVPCDEARQELNKRYDMSQAWEKEISSIFASKAPPIKNPIPIDFDRIGLPGVIGGGQGALPKVTTLPKLSILPTSTIGFAPVETNLPKSIGFTPVETKFPGTPVFIPTTRIIRTSWTREPVWRPSRTPVPAHGTLRCQQHRKRDLIISIVVTTARLRGELRV